MSLVLNMDKLTQGIEMTQKIADGTIMETEEDQVYNVVTKKVNEKVMMETSDSDIKTILENGKTIKNEIDLKQLASEVNSALGVTAKTECEGDKPPVECAKSKPVECAECKTETGVQMEKQPKLEAKVTEEKKPEAKVESIETKVEPKAEVKIEPKVEPKVEAAVAPANVAKPSLGIDTAEKFQNAVAIKQSDFVNSNTEHQVSPTADKKEVDSDAEKALKEKQAGAEKNKEFVEVAKKQTEVDVTKPTAKVENIEKFKNFVESLKDNENAPLIEAVLEAFAVVSKDA